jgi:hypothetical protein
MVLKWSGEYRAPDRRDRDTFTRDGANKLKVRIEEWWMKQGYAIECRIEPLNIRCPEHNLSHIFVVRSGLGLHMPTKMTR